MLRFVTANNTTKTIVQDILRHSHLFGIILSHKRVLKQQVALEETVPRFIFRLSLRMVVEVIAFLVSGSFGGSIAGMSSFYTKLLTYLSASEPSVTNDLRRFHTVGSASSTNSVLVQHHDYRSCSNASLTLRPSKVNY